MRATLRVLHGPKKGRLLVIPAGGLSVGRAEHCHLQPVSPEVAEEHCTFLVRHGVPYIKDLGSPQGTFVNGKRVHGEHALHGGDRIQIGPLDFDLVLVADHAVPPQARGSSQHSRPRLEAACPDRDILQWLEDEPSATTRSPSAPASPYISTDVPSSAVTETDSRPQQAAQKNARPDPQNKPSARGKRRDATKTHRKSRELGTLKSASLSTDDTTQAAQEMLEKFFHRH